MILSVMRRKYDRQFTVRAVEKTHLRLGMSFETRNEAIGVGILNRETDSNQEISTAHKGERTSWADDHVCGQLKECAFAGKA